MPKPKKPTIVNWWDRHPGLAKLLSKRASQTQAKHQSIGIEEYTWHTAKDGTVHPGHTKLDGQRFRYEDPPVTGTGRHHPGFSPDARPCRCFADPVLPKLR